MVGPLETRVLVDSGVMIVHLVGLLTLAGVAELRSLAAKRMRRDIRVYVLDARKCVIAIGPEGWKQIAREAVLRIPMALVGSEPQLPALEAHCQTMRDRGFPRYVFDDLLTAFEWALATSLQDSDSAWHDGK